MTHEMILQATANGGTKGPDLTWEATNVVLEQIAQVVSLPWRLDVSAQHFNDKSSRNVSVFT